MSANQFVVIDGNEVPIRPGETVLQAARGIGVEIPTLWEVEGANLMQPACATPTAPGMVVRTATSRVERNRRFILSLHLADTVSDRGTAEDARPSRLFDLADIHGTAGAWQPAESPRDSRPHDVNRFIAFRADRCIACSLCTRYCDQVEAVSAITLACRGSATTISTADRQSLTDTTCELCGGCIDVCPTGAMAEKPVLEYGKPLQSLETVRTTCNFCGVGCQIDLNVDRQVDRQSDRLVVATSPPPGTTVNDGNLCVKGRFANDFVHHPDRLTEPLVRGEDGALHPTSWDEALERVAQGLLGVRDRSGNDSLAFISSSRCTGEENYLVQKLARAAFETHNVHQCAAT